MVEKKEDLEELFRGNTFTVDAGKIIKAVYGKLSRETAAAFEFILRNLPNEPYLFYRNIKQKTKDGKEILIHIDANTKEQYPQGTRELIFSGPRFSWVGWEIENLLEPEKKGTDKEHRNTNYCCKVTANPINLANMLGNNGQMTNFDQLTPEYMAFNRAIKYNDKTTSAVEKILAKEYGRRFPLASIAVRGAKKAAKATNQKTEKQSLENIRKNKFTMSIDKNKLFVAVCNNTGIDADTLTIQQKYNKRKSIEHSLQLMEKYGVIIDSYSSTPDGSAWNIIFFAV